MSDSSSYIIIVGCGRLGGLLANYLSAFGHSVVVIDHLERSFEKLSAEFSGFRILGDASELTILQQANIQEADYLFAVTAQDNVNLMVAQIAKKVFGVPKVVARVYDPAREALYSEFNIETISPIHLSANAFLETCNSLTERKLS